MENVNQQVEQNNENKNSIVVLEPVPVSNTQVLDIYRAEAENELGQYRTSSLSVIMIGLDRQWHLGELSTPNLTVIFYAARLVRRYYKNRTAPNGLPQPPDCFSVRLEEDRPHPSVKNPPASKCSQCPFSRWGSAKSGPSGKGKACSERLRVIVNYSGRLNDGEGLGLIHFPPSSLRNWDLFIQELQAKKIPLSAAVVRLGFDSKTLYSKPTFTLLGVLPPDKYELVKEVKRKNNNFEDLLNFVPTKIETEEA